MAGPRSSGLKGSKASPGPRGKSVYPGDLRGSKAAPGPDPNPVAMAKGGPNERALQRANPNASFKRVGGPLPKQATPPGPVKSPRGAVAGPAAKALPGPAKKVATIKKMTRLPKPPPPRR